MRIALVIFHADPARGGAERYTLELAGMLSAAGQDVHILASSFSAVPAQTGCVELPCRSLTRRGRYLHFLDSLDRHLEGSNYDIVHAMLPVRRCDVYHPHAGVAAEAICSDPHKYANRLIFAAARVASRLNARRHSLAAVERQLLTARQPPVVLCLSDYVKKAMRRHYALEETRLVRLFNGVDLSCFDPERDPAECLKLRQSLGATAEHVLALMIAQDFRRKGLQQAIRALAELKDQRVILAVVGKDRSWPYKRLARSLGVGSQVLFVGPAPDPRPFYQAADFLLLPTRHDPCSLVVLEALAMGLPVISTAQNGACEVMEHGVHGFILPHAEDLAGLCEAMRRLLNEPLRRQMRQAALSLRQSLSVQEHVRKLQELYQSLRAPAGRSVAAVQ